MNRREREKLFRKHEIIKAALQIFAQKGYKATTLDEIAEKSEFGKGTIYNYFSSKEEIYTEIITSVIEQHQIIIRKIDEKTVTLHDFVEELLASLIRFSRENKESFLLLLFTEIHQSFTASTEISRIMDNNKQKMTEFFVQKASKAIENKEIRDVDLERVIRLFRGLGFNYIYDLLVSGKLKEEFIQEEAKFITDILFNGIKY
ncbi:MAG: TetR/AcrR family transcriptional regulator [Chlorobi bacterium]|nr:TetR/AcrR family transcriptional regulator [Chlorobiota bacterium]